MLLPRDRIPTHPGEMEGPLRKRLPRGLSLVLASLAFLGVGPTAGADPPSPLPVVPPGKLVFVDFIDRTDRNSSEIFTIWTDGSHRKRLTFDNVPSESPAWSPDGRRIAYVSRLSGEREIWLMNADGSGQHRLTHTSRIGTNWNEGEIYPSCLPGVQMEEEDGYCAVAPRWSPDGRELLYSAHTRMEREMKLWVTPVEDPNEPRCVAKWGCGPGGYPQLYPTFSPDGTAIGFTWPNSPNDKLVTYTLDGRSELIFESTRSDPSGPVYSPLGLTIVLSKYRVTSCGPNCASGYERALFRVGVDGTNLKQLTFPVYDINCREADRDPTFFALGTHIAFSRTGDAGLDPDVCGTSLPRTSETTERIMILNLVDGTLTDLTSGVEPDWAPICTILGTPGNDVLVGTSERDIICGFGGDDTIHGKQGRDLIKGGRGDDVLFGDEGVDTLIDIRGRDRFYGGPGSDRMFARDANRDRLFGGPKRDQARVNNRRDSFHSIESRRLACLTKGCV